MNATPEYPRKYLLSRTDYHRMVDADIFAPDARIELIDGEIVEMSPANPAHQSVANLLNERFKEAFDGTAITYVEKPIGMGNCSEPQPDCSVLRFREDQYLGRSPEAEDIILCVEVSDSSYRYDLDTKLPLYARHGIPTVWIADIKNCALHVFDHLTETSYGQSKVITKFESLDLPVGSRYSVNLNGLF